MTQALSPADIALIERVKPAWLQYPLKTGLTVGDLLQHLPALLNAARAEGRAQPPGVEEAVARMIYERARERLRVLRGRHVIPAWRSPQMLPESADIYMADAESVLRLLAEGGGGSSRDLSPSDVDPDGIEGSASQ